MKRIFLPVALFALALVAQPVLMAWAKTQLFVTEEQAETSKDSQGRTNVYNSLPDEGKGYSVPYLNDKGTGSNKSSSGRYGNAKMPKTWKVLDKQIIKNRVDDTKNALAFSSKQRRHMNAVNVSSSVEDDAEEAAKKQAREAKKKAKKAAKEMDSVGQPKEEDGETTVTEAEGVPKKKGIKFRKKTVDSDTPRVFNLPD